MSEDRMLSDEILLALIKKNSSGGGGGTTNYNDLDNLPQIGGVTLQGNKTASDLGLATETALADKADKSAIKNEFLGTLEEWNALTTEQKKAYDTYQFTDDFTEGRYIYLPTIYSEEERQVGVWKDGKPLYQKTITVPSVSYDTSFHEVAHNISDIDSIGSVEGVVVEVSDDNATYYSVNTYKPAYTLGILIGASKTNIQYMNNWLETASSLIITLQYTKTTDTAGSGIWTPSGEIAHHYSADEQIVGKWADGSTVWEKTQIGGIIISANDTWYDTNITGVSRVVSFGCSLMRDNEQIGNSFNGGSIDYIVRDGVLKIKGHGFSQAENYSLGHLTVQYTKTA